MVNMKLFFEWGEEKNHQNLQKHSVTFELAQEAFTDVKRLIAEDKKHSFAEKRYYCFGKVGTKVTMVPFTYRKQTIRIIGAGYWIEGKIAYEEKNRK